MLPGSSSTSSPDSESSPTVGPAKYISPFGDTDEDPVVPDANGRLRSAAGMKHFGPHSARTKTPSSRSHVNSAYVSDNNQVIEPFFSLPNTPDTEETIVQKPQQPVIKLMSQVGGESYI